MTEKQIIYSMHKVGKVYRQKTVLKDISLSYFYGAKIGVLGNNGSGKSTLLRIMAGVEDDYLGTTTMSKGHRVGFLEQSPRLEEEKTVLETVKEGAKETVQLLAQFEEISAKFADPLEEEEMNQLLQKQAQLQDRLDAVNAWDLDSRLELAMNALGCPPPDALCEKLSGGEKRRVALCRLLLEEPDILLLDEPTNHLDAQTVWWLEKHLQQYKGTVIAVTHDRYFLDNVAGWILELDRGEGIPFQGNYSAWLTTKAKRLATEEKRESKRQKAMAEELDWIRSSPSARRSKNKARIKNYQTRVKESRQKYQETGEIYIPPGPRLGEMVISAQNVTMAFGDKTLFSNLNFTLPAGGIVGVIGPNGAGKSTLFRLMAKELTPLEGSFKVGETVDLSFVDQDRDLPLNETILQAVTDGQDFLTIDGREVNARAYLARYNFSGEEQKENHWRTIGRRT